jgi:UDP-glucuronate decarboxylase
MSFHETRMTTAGRIIEDDIEGVLARLELPGLSKARFLVAGAGMLGTYVALALSRVSSEVSVLVREPQSVVPWLRVRTISGDLEAGELPPLGGITHVVNCAGPTGRYVEDLLSTIRVNTGGLDRLIEAASNCEVFVTISSTRVYGQASAARAVDEADPGEVNSLSMTAAYDESKRLGETLCYAHWHERGFPARIIRLSNVYGPLQSLSSRLAIPDFLSAALAGRDIVVRGHRENRRNYCYVSDAVVGILAALSVGTNGEVYNIAGKESSSIGAIAEWVGELAGCAVAFSADGNNAAPKDDMICIEKARERLHYEPQCGIREGLRRTYRWQLDQRSSEARNR